MQLGAPFIRGVLGPLFVGHGTQKLFGWFGGHGIEGTGAFFEYNLVLITALAGLVDNGPGRPSLDDALLPRLKGPGWAAISLGAAVAGSYLATSERMSAAVSDSSEDVAAGPPGESVSTSAPTATAAGA